VVRKKKVIFLKKSLKWLRSCDGFKNKNVSLIFEFLIHFEPSIKKKKKTNLIK